MTDETRPTIDFAFTDHGTVWLIEPLNEVAENHAEEVFGADVLSLGRAIACQPRYVADNAHRLLRDGFRVSLDGEEITLREDA